MRLMSMLNLMLLEKLKIFMPLIDLLRGVINNYSVEVKSYS